MFLHTSFSSHFDVSLDTILCGLCHEGQGSVAGSQASQNSQENIVLLKLLTTISMALSNIQLDMLSSKC